jgi:two-component system sensor histidine kinase CiaH
LKLPSLPGVSVPRLALPRIGWPGLRQHRPGEAADPVDSEPLMLGAPVVPARPPLDADDVRILRRTRLRLMAVSGLVTAAILLVLGTVTYFTADRLLANSGETVVRNAASVYLNLLQDDPRPLHRAVGFNDEISSLVAILIPPAGSPESIGGPDPGAAAPDQASLSAARSGATDMRVTTLALSSGGSVPVRILSVPAPGGAVLQVIQNRTPEIHFMSTLFEALVGVSIAALLLSILAGYFYAGRALVPIRASMTRREAALQRQREFAANASHELRTPLTVIGASVEDLRRNRRSRVQDVGEALGDIDAEVRHMTALVEDLLLLARTDSGVVQVDKVPVDLADVAVEAASMLTAVADEKAVTLELDPLPVFVMGDQLRLRQLVTILTDNAIKHTRSASTVRVRIAPDGGLALLRVEDEGAGVRPQDLSRIFERFWRADNAPAGGTGLGLSIAKWIVEQHGGTIGAFNRPEGGATFWATMPVWSPNPSTEPLEADETIWAAPNDGLEEQLGLGDEPDGDDHAPENGWRELPSDPSPNLAAHD